MTGDPSSGLATLVVVSSPAATSRPPLPRDVWILSLVGFLVAVGFGVLIPVMPVVARSFGVNNFAIGAVVSALPVLRLLTSPFVPRMLGWIGARITLGLGTLIVAISSAGCGLATTYSLFLVARGLGGIGSAMFGVAAMTILLAATPAQLRGRASAIYSGSFLIGNMAGPAVGALLAAISIRAPFFFYALTLVAASAVAWIMLRTSENAVRIGQQSAANQEARPMREVAKDARYWAACATNFVVGWQSFGARSLLIPIIVVEVLDEPTTTTGVILAIAAVVQGLALAPVGKAVDEIGRRPLLVAGLLISAVTSLFFAQAATVVLLAVLLAIFALGSSALATAPTALIGDSVGGGRGTPVAISQMIGDLGSIFGPLVAGALADAWSMQAAFAIGSALMLSVAIFSWFGIGRQSQAKSGTA